MMVDNFSEKRIIRGKNKEKYMEETKKEKKTKGKRTAYQICIVAMFVAITAVCAWISIPIGAVPGTLQTLAVCLAGGLLGKKRGTIAILAYILLGAVGVPVFSSFRATAALVGPTGGYIVGFLFTAFLSGLAGEIAAGKKKSLQIVILAAGMAIGVLVCYAFGTAWFLIYKATADAAVGLAYALSVCVIPFIPFDIAKIAAAIVLTLALKRFVK